MRRLLLALVLGTPLALLVFLFAWAVPGEAAEDTRRPNIVFVSTNDQDAASLEQMAYAGGAFQAESKTFTNHTFAYPLCCPSRVTWMRGQYPHNHTVWTNTAAKNGGYRRFKALGYHRENLATRLKANGYRTGMFGNYVNEADYDTKPPGWDVFVDAFVGPGGSKNRAVTDELISDNAVRYARKHAGGNRPLFQWVGYRSPHHPFDYEPRFANKCQDSGLPPSPAIDEDTDEELADKPQFIRETAEAFSWNTDERIAQDYKDRCRALQTPDEGLRRIVKEYRAKGELSETYFVFGTDNGLLLGEHGLRGKEYPYVESARFPLIVRGPGVAQGTEDDRMVSNVDIMPTFLDIANASVPGYVDGESMLPAWKGQAEATVRDMALVEGKRLARVPNYSGLVDQEWTYTEWADGSKEYYDLTTDPYQLTNAYGSLNEARKAELHERTRSLAGCARATCRSLEE